MGGADLDQLDKSCPDFEKYFCFILPKYFCFLGQDLSNWSRFLHPLFMGFLIILIIPS